MTAADTGSTTSAPARLARAEGARLLVVDLQTRLMAALPADAAERVERNSLRLIEAAQALGIPITASLQYPQGLGALRPAIAAALERVTSPLTGDTSSPTAHDNGLHKTAFSCCAAPGLAQRLGVAGESAVGGPASGDGHGQGDVVICGVEAHICVLQTALELHARAARHQRIFVVSDAVASRDADHRADALARLRAEGVIVANHESILFEWLRDAAHPAFKQISALIR